MPSRGALYGLIPGLLKAFTGAHEVVTTIMLNSIAVSASAIVGLVNDVFRITGPTFARTAGIGNATMPILIGRNGNLGIVIAVLVVPVVYTGCSGGHPGV